MPDIGPPRIADGEGAVMFGVAGAVPPCPGLPKFKPPCAGVRGGFRGDPSGRLLEVDGPLLSLFWPDWSLEGPLAGEGGGIMPFWVILFCPPPPANCCPWESPDDGEPAFPDITLFKAPGGKPPLCKFCMDCRYCCSW
jgi:hypothetical protein